MIENPNTIAAVIGDPIKHSRSPLIHNYWLKQIGISGTYEAIKVSAENLELFCRSASESQIKGFNVTLPHKENILEYCDEIEESARKIGAANTVRVRPDGHHSAYNTDAYGFLENLRQGVPEFDFEAGPVVVIGAGGAARAVLYALQSQNVPYIILTNRSTARADTLAKEFGGIEVIPWSDRANVLSEANLLVNTTSLGMEGQPDLEIEPFSLPTDAIVYDLVYNPLQTGLLKKAAARGNPALGGLGMLVYQAEKAFELWFGQKPAVTEELMRLLKESL